MLLSPLWFCSSVMAPWNVSAAPTSGYGLRLESESLIFLPTPTPILTPIPTPTPTLTPIPTPTPAKSSRLLDSNSDFDSTPLEISQNQVTNVLKPPS
ncbi:hypothetical protein E2C01_033922 [Portunus trituberculatus]|uniref:Uncharacterized protein n=1 Tax=Portunus trituberculatus TaxID=210409 RepID=A0A5B7F4S7_PORTR|nr:hypothetical protein [Portunus trituberculatus]